LKAEAAAAAKAREAAAAAAKAKAAEEAAAETEAAEPTETTVVESAEFELTEVEADTAMAADDAAPAEEQPLAPDFFDDTLPSDRDEPAWIIQSRELTEDEANLGDEPKPAPSQWKPTSHGNKWLPRQTVVPAPHSSDRDETSVISASAESTDAATVAPLLTTQDTSRAIRAMKDITPDYDLTVDQDIRTYADEQAAKFGVKFGDQPFEPRAFPETVMPWEAPNLFNYPLYFEDPALERYGHTRSFFVQPFVSAGRFTGQLLALPYQMAIDPIGEEMYALGYYRPGDCAPKLKYKVPWNAKAAAVEATVVTGLIFLIP
jgi:hypothetical protein